MAKQLANNKRGYVVFQIYLLKMIDYLLSNVTGWTSVLWCLFAANTAYLHLEIKRFLPPWFVFFFA